MFKIGNMAVYPAHGVVQIQGIEVKEICGRKKDFYILKVIDNDVTVMVPTDNALSVGLRPVINKNHVKKIYAILKSKNKSQSSLNGNQSWNKRYREYADKLKSGNVFEIAEVLKEIHLLQGEKELSFGEKRVFEMARSLLVKEISIAKDVEEERVSSEIDELLASL
jgi:CarD family transcriptional regulator